MQSIFYEEGGTLIPFHVNQVVVTSTWVSGLEPVLDDGVRYHLVQVSA